MLPFCALMYLAATAGFVFWGAIVGAAYASVRAPFLSQGVLILAMAGVFPLAAALVWPIVARLRRQPGPRRGLLGRAPIWLRVLFWLSALHLAFEAAFVFGVMQGGTLEQNPAGGGQLVSHDGQVIRVLSPAAYSTYQRQLTLLLPSLFLFAYAFLMAGYRAVLGTLAPDRAENDKVTR